MTPALEALARRAIAARDWRWMPGMRATNSRSGPRGRVMDSTADCVLIHSNEGTFNGPPHSDIIPDLTDPATMGCLLALVRERHSDACACVLPIDYGPAGVMWVCRLTAGGRSLTDRHWRTEAEALVAALEAPCE